MNATNSQEKYQKVGMMHELSASEDASVDAVEVGKSDAVDAETEAKGNTDAMYDRENVPFTIAVLPALLAAGADYFGLGAIGPLLPYYVFDQGESDVDAWVGYITTAQFFGVLLGGLIMSRIGDVYGLRRTLQMTMAADVLFFVLSGYAPTVQLLCLCRFFAGFFTPLVPSISWVINASDNNPTAKRNTVGANMAMWALSMSLSYMAGSAMAGVLGPARWTLVHVITGCFAAVACTYFFFVREPPRADSGIKPEGIDVILAQPEYLALCVNNVSVGMLFTGGLVSASLILMELGSDSLQLAYYFLCCSLTHGVINFLLLPWAIKKYGSPFPAMTAVAINATLSTVLLCFDFAYDNMALLFLLMIATSNVLPIFMTAANIINGEYAARYTLNARTVVLGMARSAFNVGQVLGPIVAVALLKVDRVAWFVGILVITLSTWLVWYYYHNRAIAVRAAKAALKTDTEPVGEVEGGLVSVVD